MTGAKPDMEKGLAPAKKDPAIDIRHKLKEAYTLRLVDLKESVRQTLEILTWCQQEGYAYEAATAKNHLGLFYMIQGEFQKAIQYTEEALQFYESAQDTMGIADAKYNIGSVHYRTNKYHLGLIFLLDCLLIYRQLGDFHKQARTLKSIGTIYEYFHDYEKAIESYESSIEASQEVDDLSAESNALNPLSGIYVKQGLIEKAYATIERSISLKKITNDIRGLAYAYYGRAKILIREKKYTQAVDDLEISIDTLIREGDKLGLGMAYNKMGVAHLENQNFVKANDFFQKALVLAEKYSVQWIRFKANFNLYLLSKKAGDTAKALDYLEKYFLQKEEVINNETYSIIKSYDTISKIKLLEREAHSQKERSEIIEKKNAELDSFFYRVSHDLKGPISSLLGLHGVVSMEVQDESSMRFFKMYHSQVLRMNDIVMGLINLTEINNTEQLKTKIDFTKLVDECVDSCQYLPEFSKIRIDKSIENFEYYSEWAIINTILQNLIENAIKYSRPNAESFLKVRIYSEPNQVILIVSDNGQGIPEAHQSNIFNMFYRATQRSQGSGLGLYILKRAIERLNGAISFTSVLNEGSTFIIKLPVG